MHCKGYYFCNNAYPLKIVTFLTRFLTASIVSTSGLRNDFVVVGVDLGFYAKKVQNVKKCGKCDHSGRNRIQ